MLDGEIEAKFGRYPQMFERLFNAVDNQVNFHFYQVIDGEYPQDIDECDGYLITGSRHDSFAQTPWILELSRFISTLAEQDKKLIGICFGHQLIAHTLGGQAARCDKGWGVGVHDYALNTDLNLAWMDSAPKRLRLPVTHQDQVLSLPNKATVLASSPFCRYAAYVIEANILCFQGHPEFSTEFGRELLLQRQDIIEKSTYVQAYDSFADENDNQQVARWMLAFMRT